MIALVIGIVRIHMHTVNTAQLRNDIEMVVITYAHSKPCISMEMIAFNIRSVSMPSIDTAI